MPSETFRLASRFTKRGSLIAVTHNPEILGEADLVITMRDGEVNNVKGRVGNAI